MDNRFRYVEEAQRGKSEYVLSVRDDEKKKIYRFTLKTHRIRVEPENDWDSQLPESVQLEVFAKLMATYRQRSNGKDIKTAAIGITERNEIFIANNTEHRGDDDGVRDCAEQNMVNIYRQRAKTHQHSKLKRVYVMGGSDTGEPHIICPCGSCTDMLAKQMVSNNAPIIILPVNADKRPIALNSDAKKIFDIQSDQGWQTSIGHLNQVREISLNDEGKKYAEIGFHELIAHMPHPPSVDTFPAFRRHLTDNDAVSAHKILKVEDALKENSAVKFAQFAQQQIYTALHNRLDENFNSLTLSERQAFIANYLHSIEVAAVRFADGTIKEAVRVRSKNDKASMPAITIAAQSYQVANQPIADVWYQEFNPQKALLGIMRTPNKESIERAIKRGPHDKEIQFHVVPFMRLSLNEKSLEKHTLHCPASDLFVGYFKGAKHLAPVKNPLAIVKTPQLQGTAAKDAGLSY